MGLTSLQTIVKNYELVLNTFNLHKVHTWNELLHMDFTFHFMIREDNTLRREKDIGTKRLTQDTIFWDQTKRHLLIHTGHL